MNIPQDLKYSKDHEWVRVDGDIAVIGITDYAQSELGDIVMVEFPEPGAVFGAGDTVGTLEAVKTVSDVMTPVDGELIELNDALDDEPELINSDPYGKGWIVRIKVSTVADLDGLLSADEYAKLID